MKTNHANAKTVHHYKTAVAAKNLTATRKIATNNPTAQTGGFHVKIPHQILYLHESPNYD